MVAYQVHYCNFDSGEEVAADGAVELELEQLIELMDRILTAPGCFVSAAGEDGTMIQFVVDEDGSVLLDVPAPAERGSYAKSDTLAACKALVRRLAEAGAHVSHEDIDGLVFERW